AEARAEPADEGFQCGPERDLLKSALTFQAPESQSLGLHGRGCSCYGADHQEGQPAHHEGEQLQQLQTFQRRQVHRSTLSTLRAVTSATSQSTTATAVTMLPTKVRSSGQKNSGSNRMKA